MNPQKKAQFVNKLTQLKAVQTATSNLVRTPIGQVPSVPVGAPIPLQVGIGPQFAGLGQHMQQYQSLLNLLEDIVKEL